jgi:predicted HTH transcriptional regulator
LSARAISTKLDVASKTVERAIKKLKELGYIQCEGSDKKGTWKVLR